MSEVSGETLFLSSGVSFRGFNSLLERAKQQTGLERKPITSLMDNTTSYRILIFQKTLEGTGISLGLETIRNFPNIVQAEVFAIDT